MIIAGHTRYKAARKLHLETVPCLLADDLTDEQVKAFRLADNKVSEKAEWDIELLAAEIAELEDFNMDDFGFEVEIEAEGNEVVEDDFNEELPEEPTAKLGDIYQLGRHRLMCGDSTNEQNVLDLLGGEQIDTVMTDPPYDMQMGGQGCFTDSMKNCKERVDGIINWDPFRIDYLSRLDCGSFYVFTSKNGIPKYMEIFKDFNFNILVWCKTNPVPFTSGSFLPDVEYLLHFTNNKKIWNNSLKPTEIYKKYYISSKLEGREGVGDVHPTMKPVKLISDKLRISSNKNGNVLDIFGGSGTTLICCEQLERNCYMLEYDPRYVDVIIKRWEDFTGQKAELVKRAE